MRMHPWCASRRSAQAGRLSVLGAKYFNLKMEREAAIRLLRALVAVGLRQRESMANATIRSVAFQAGLKEFDQAQRYARGQGWLIAAGKAFSTTLTPPGWKVAKANEHPPEGVERIKFARVERDDIAQEHQKCLAWSSHC
jgi:hypothetical protein